MLKEENIPNLKSMSISNDDKIIQKSKLIKYSDVLKQKNTNTIDNNLKFNEIDEKEINKTDKTNRIINDISKKTKEFALNEKSPLEHGNFKPLPEENKDGISHNKENDIQKKYKNNLESIIKIQAWWRAASKIKSVENMKKVNNEEKNNEQKKDNVAKTITQKSSLDVVKENSSPLPINNEKLSNNSKKQNKKNKKNKNKNKNNNENENKNIKNNDNDNESKSLENEIKNQSDSINANEELNTNYKNMKFMGLIEKEIDDLTEKNTIVNGKQFAKTKIVTIKKYSRYGYSSNFNIDIVDNIKDNKKKDNKNENKSNNKKSYSKKNVCFNEKDEVFNEYNHVMKKLNIQRRCDKKSCLIDCYRRLYKRDWEEDEELSEISSGSESEEESATTLKKKSVYSYNDIYNPNYTKYYSGSDFDFSNRYFTGKERLKKALNLEPVEVTVQKIVYQPINFQKNKHSHSQKKKNGNKRKQKN